MTRALNVILSRADGEGPLNCVLITQSTVRDLMSLCEVLRSAQDDGR
jgi:hypothetical protein